MASHHQDDEAPSYRPDSPVCGASSSGKDLPWALSNIEPNTFQAAIYSLAAKREDVHHVEDAASYAGMPAEWLKHLLRSERRSDGSSSFQLTALGEEYMVQQFNSWERENFNKIIASR